MEPYHICLSVTDLALFHYNKQSDSLRKIFAMLPLELVEGYF